MQIKHKLLRTFGFDIVLFSLIQWALMAGNGSLLHFLRYHPSSSPPLFFAQTSCISDLYQFPTKSFPFFSVSIHFFKSLIYYLIHLWSLLNSAKSFRRQNINITLHCFQCYFLFSSFYSLTSVVLAYAIRLGKEGWSLYRETSALQRFSLSNGREGLF